MKVTPLLLRWMEEARNLGFDFSVLEQRVAQLQAQPGAQITQWTKSSIRDAIDTIEKELDAGCKAAEITRDTLKLLGPRRYTQGPLALLQMVVTLRDVQAANQVRESGRPDWAPSGADVEEDHPA